MLHTIGATEAHVIAPDAPEYVSIKEAADALASRPWPVAALIGDGELRAVRFGTLVLVSRYDVEQLGGEFE